MRLFGHEGYQRFGPKETGLAASRSQKPLSPSLSIIKRLVLSQSIKSGLYCIVHPISFEIRLSNHLSLPY